MELVAGPTLADVIARGPVPWRAAVGYAIEIADALSVAHAVGIVHRDLKPTNIVISEEGHAKVLDFGIAKVDAPDGVSAFAGSTATAFTGDHAVLGTIGYMSPEQAHGRPVDARSVADVLEYGLEISGAGHEHWSVVTRPVPRARSAWRTRRCP